MNILEKMIKGIPWIATFIISIIALNISIDSRNISKDALKVSKEEIRPYLQIRPKTIDKKDAFIDVLENNDGIKILVILEMVNKGRIPAENISIKSIIEQFEPGVIDATGDNLRAQIISKSPIFLAPDETIYLNLVVDYKLSPDKRGTLIDNINDNKQHFTVNTTVYYSSKLDPTTKYATTLFDISKNRIFLLKSGLDQFQADFSMGKMFYFKTKKQGSLEK